MLSLIHICADKMSSLVDYTDRATCVLFGDGAGAVLVEATEEMCIRDSFFTSRFGGLAQLARAPALQAGGQRFESVILHYAF